MTADAKSIRRMDIFGVVSILMDNVVWRLRWRGDGDGAVGFDESRKEMRRKGIRYIRVGLRKIVRMRGLSVVESTSKDNFQLLGTMW